MPALTSRFLDLSFAYTSPCLIACLTILTMGCTPQTPMPNQTKQPIKETTVPQTKEVVVPSPDMARHEGILEMARVGGYKALQATTLIKKDGSTLLLSYRPMPEYLDLVGTAVVITGNAYHPTGQAVRANHFKVASIAPINSSDKRTPRNTLPPTPALSSLAEAGALHKRWVHVHGTFEKTSPHKESSSRTHVEFLIKNDTSITLNLMTRDVTRSWMPHKGKPITVVGQVFVMPDKDGTPVAQRVIISDPFVVCAGHIDDCGAVAP